MGAPRVREIPPRPGFLRHGRREGGEKVRYAEKCTRYRAGREKRRPTWKKVSPLCPARIRKWTSDASTTNRFTSNCARSTSVRAFGEPRARAAAAAVPENNDVSMGTIMYLSNRATSRRFSSFLFFSPHSAARTARSCLKGNGCSTAREQRAIFIRDTQNIPNMKITFL